MSIIYTIGYEGASFADFIATLHAAKIKRVVDVRELPQSRRPGFSRNVLAAALHVENIAYEHRKRLGDPKPGRDAARAGRHDEFKQIFRAHMDTIAAKDELRDLVATLYTDPCVLLCYERSPEHCHRKLLCDDLQRLGLFEIQHLGVRSLTQSWGKVTDETERHAGAR